MLRPHSTDKCSYENISSRLTRLRNITASIPTNLVTKENYPNYRSRTRLGVNVEENGMFAAGIGRVSKNTGIRKYNERMIKEATNPSRHSPTSGLLEKSRPLYER